MRHTCIAMAAALALMSASTALTAECGTPEDGDSPNKTHTYVLAVTSTSGSPVQIAGSVALMGPDSFVQIDAETPYTLTVCGVNILLIVGALDAADRIDFSLSIDGQESWSGEDNTAISVGEDVLRPGSSFSSNYRAPDASK